MITLPYLVKEANLNLFEKHGVYSKVELHSRYDILLENYIKTENIEALTCIDMAKKLIMPAVVNYLADSSANYLSAAESGLDLDLEFVKDDIKKLSVMCKDLNSAIKSLEAATHKAQSTDVTLLAQAKAYRDAVVPAMFAVRKAADALEGVVAKSYWPFPTYSELLFNV